MPNQVFDQRFYTVDNQRRSELSGVAVTPSDSVDLPNGTTAALFVTGAGNVSLDIETVSIVTGALTAINVTLNSVPANTRIGIRASRVRATSTTATGIFALYVASNL
jgi:hypothetical protein